MAQLLGRATWARSFFSKPGPKSAPVRFQRSSFCMLRTGRIYCFFSNGRKQEQAKKALEDALSQKKEEFEKWNKQKEKQEQAREGGTGKGGRYGGGDWYGRFVGDHFWEDAKQTTIIILGIISLYLILAKGEVIFAVVSNALLFVLRKMREPLDYLFSFFSQNNGTVPVSVPLSETLNSSYRSPALSAKERVIRKWRMD